MKLKIKIFISLLAAFFLAATPGLTLAGYTYKVMETIPGFINSGDCTNFNAYIAGVYKFGIWVVGIAALLMLSIGAFMYLTSAGNKAAAGSAKNVITDAIIGLIMALTAYFILYQINPDLVSPPGIDDSTSTCSSNSTTTSTTAAASTTSSGSFNGFQGGSSGGGGVSGSYGDKSVTQSDLTASEVKSQLAAGGVNVWSSGSCFDKDAKGCTNLNGVSQTAIDGAIDIDKNVGDVTVTAATETAGHAKNTNHADGYTLDLQLSNTGNASKMDAYLKEQVAAGKVTQVCSNSYSYNCGASEPKGVYHVQWAKA